MPPPNGTDPRTLSADVGTTGDSTVGVQGTAVEIFSVSHTLDRASEVIFPNHANVFQRYCARERHLGARHRVLATDLPSVAPAVQRANALADATAKMNALLAVQTTQRRAAANQMFPLLNARDEVVDGTLRAMAVFCHGFSDGCEAGLINENAARFAQAVHAATAAAGGHAHPAAQDLRVVLYCCLCAHSHPPSASEPENEGHNSLAENLCAALRDAGLAGAQVDAHVVAGHSVRNTAVRRFFASPPGDTSAGSTHRGIYRETMVSVHRERAIGAVSGRALFYVWYSMLVPHDNDLDMHFREPDPNAPGTLRRSTLWMRFPFMSLEEVRRELADSYETFKQQFEAWAATAPPSLTQGRHQHPAMASFRSRWRVTP